MNTRRVLSQAESGADPRRAAMRGPDSGRLLGGNGALMRTAPVALAYLGDDTALMEAARAVASLTHHDELAGESCAVWCIAIDRAICEDRLDGSWDALDLLPAHSCDRWSGWLAATPKGSAMSFKPNGFTVHCLHAALAVVLQNTGAELANSLRAAVEVGDDTDTVACVAGALLGARWGAAAVPARWRDRLHDRWGHSHKDPERLALAIIDCDWPCGGRSAAETYDWARMVASREPAPDPIDDEARRVFADPAVRASIEDYIRRRDAGELGPGHTTEEVIKRLGLDPIDLDEE